MKYTDYKHILQNRLDKLITANYILLDLPYFPNVGDLLIWEATLQLLSNNKYKCLYSSSQSTYKKQNISNDVIIVFMGGGNFGDLWENHQIFRHKVLKDYPDNPIVQLPQSVFFNSKEKLAFDVSSFVQHKGSVTICLRDLQSYTFVKSHYCTVRAELLPDMVLAFDVSHYIKKHNLFIVRKGENLFVSRHDSERVERDYFVENMSNVDFADWPSMEGKCWQVELYNKVAKALGVVHLSIPISLQNLLYKKYLKDIILKSGICFIGGYQRIYTTRLHCGILGWLLGKEVAFYDNTYGKISGVFNAWMNEEKNVELL